MEAEYKAFTDTYGRTLLAPATKNPSKLSEKIKQDFNKIIEHFAPYKPSYISTPFKGTCLKMGQKEDTFIFASSESRIATCNIDKKQLILDHNLNQGPIWCIELSKDESAFFVGCHNGLILKINSATLDIEEQLDMHKEEVMCMALSRDNRLLFSVSSDRSVLKWEITKLENGRRPCVKLHSHSSQVLSLDLSSDEIHLATGSADGVVTVFSLFENSDIFSTKAFNAKVTSIKISVNNVFLILGSDSGEIQIWKFGSWTLSRTAFAHEGGVRCLEIGINEKFFVSGGSDSLIKVWNLEKWQDEAVIQGHNGEITSLLITKDAKSIYSMSNDCRIMISKVPEFENHINLPSDSNIQRFLLNPKDRYLYAFNKRHELLQVQPKSLDKIAFIGEPIISWYMIKTGTQIAMFLEPKSSTELVVGFIELHGQRNSTFKSLRTDSRVISATISEDGSTVVIGETYHVTVIDIATDRRKIFRSHSTAVTALVLKDQHLFAGDRDGIIKYYTLGVESEEKEQMIDDTHSPVTMIKLLLSEKLILSANEAGTILVWSFEKFQCINHIYMYSLIKEIYFTGDNQNFIVNSGNFLTIWNIENLSKISTITLESNNEAIGVSFFEKHIFVSFEGYYKIIESPLKTEKIGIYGDHSQMHNFIQYLVKIINGEVPKHLDSMDDWIIEPFHINTLHIYAYFNLYRHLEKSIAEGGSFFLSRDGYTPMSISIEKKFSECIDSIYESLKARSKTDKMVLCCLSSSLASLNRSSYTKLHDLYNIAFGQAFALTMPKFCEDSENLPKVVKSKRYFVPGDRFIEAYKYKYEELAIEFMQSFVTVNTKLGSNDSLDFMKSLIECKNTEVYCTGFIRTILEDKWRDIQWLLTGETILYLAYLVIICGFCFNKNYDFVLNIAFGINILLFIYEILQMVASKFMYFKSFWNYIDMTRLLSFLTYWVCYTFEYLEDYQQQRLLILTVFLSLIRGISYFRIIPSTRWIVKLIFDVASELWALIFIVAYTILSSGFIYRGLIKDVSFLESLSINDVDEFKLQWISFLFVLIINPIIILNLYLAIIGDTFEKSQNEKMILDGQELAEMIYEGEILLFCNRRYKKAKFLHVLREEHIEMQAQNTSGQRIKTINDSVAGVESICYKNTNDIGELREFVEGQSKKIGRTTKAILETLKNKA